MSSRVESDHIGLNLQFQTISNEVYLYLYCIWQKKNLFEAKSDFHKFKFSTPDTYSTTLKIILPFKMHILQSEYAIFLHKA